MKKIAIGIYQDDDTDKVIGYFIVNDDESLSFEMVEEDEELRKWFTAFITNKEFKEIVGAKVEIKDGHYVFTDMRRKFNTADPDFLEIIEINLPDDYTVLDLDREFEGEYIPHKIIHIIEVQALNNYQLMLTFEDGVKKLYDMKPKLYGVFEPLRDIEKFKEVYIEDGTVKWTGDLDLCPGSLYENAVTVE